MFTGIIEEVGSINKVEKTTSGYRIEIRCDKILDDLKIGDSISVDGVCQTVEFFNGHGFQIFASKITAELTTLCSLKSGTAVNLERALRPDSRMGGHIVQGHVEGTGIIETINKDSEGIAYIISASKNIMKYIVEKGSIAINGISLTVVSVADNSFGLYIIPETVRKTTLQNCVVGSRVNIETDIIAKYLEKLITPERKNNDKEIYSKLSDAGFL